MATLCDKYGSLVYLRLGNVDAITTNDSDTIREILFRQDDVLSSRPKTLAAVHLAYGCGDVALAPMGPHWKRMRRICMEHLLTTKRLESFTAQRAEETRYLIADVYKRAECGKLINLREVLGAFSMNNVTRMLLAREAILWARVCSRRLLAVLEMGGSVRLRERNEGRREACGQVSHEDHRGAQTDKTGKGR
ncbi:hypothetical protein DY000_02058390 [Brassica cretica]|uniref:Uncharacterized protein n=1 Tax=Brassica cretica TaxID=69181 RepID=A0ABQ7A7Q4_BRACR|nr:hypothetical protein DY000_02058390 [Brassica cretica]